MNKQSELRFVTELAKQLFIPGFAQEIKLWEIYIIFYIYSGEETTLVLNL